MSSGFVGQPEAFVSLKVDGNAKGCGGQAKEGQRIVAKQDVRQSRTRVILCAVVLEHLLFFFNAQSGTKQQTLIWKVWKWRGFFFLMTTCFVAVAVF